MPKTDPTNDLGDGLTSTLGEDGRTWIADATTGETLGIAHPKPTADATAAEVARVVAAVRDRITQAEERAAAAEAIRAAGSTPTAVAALRAKANPDLPTQQADPEEESEEIKEADNG